MSSAPRGRAPVRRTTLRGRALASMALATLLGWPAAAHAQVSFSFTFQDMLGSPNAGFYPLLEENTRAAAEQWVSNVAGVAPGPIDISVQFEFTNAIPRATGHSQTTGFVANVGGMTLWQDGFLYELLTGIDPNGTTQDIEIQLNPDYLANNLWFDPNLATRSTPIPPFRTDAYTVMLHELGHSLYFNGWRDWTTGLLPGNYLSTWDQWVDMVGGYQYFVGPAAEALYGGPVPLTAGNITHVGNAFPGPGSEPALLDDLMNGVVFNYQQRYDITPLDLAILADARTIRPAAVVPEPTTVLLLVTVGIPGLAIAMRRRRHG